MPPRRLLLFLLIAPLAFFWPLFTPVPGVQQTIVAGDFLFEYFPQRVFAGRELWAGHFPLWNPHIYAGQPGLHEPQIALLYPPAWITLLLGGPGGAPWWLVEVEAVLHLGLAGVFMFVLVRRLTGAPRASALAAVAFMFGGYLTSWPLNQLSVLEGSVWLPLIIYLLDLGLERGLRYFALAAMAWALCFFAGHPQVPIYALYAGALFVAWRAWTAPAAALRERFARPLVGLAVFGLLGVGLAMVQILPTYELEQNSGHPDMPLEVQAHGLSPIEIGGLLVPAHWGNPALYTGMLPLGLALIALAAGRRGGRERWFWALLALGALTLSFGGVTPLYWLLRAVAPGFTLIRDQERALALWSFAVSVLAGFGAAALEQREDAPQESADGELPARRALAVKAAGEWGLPLTLALLAALALALVLRVPLALRPDERPEVLALYARSSAWAVVGALALLAAVWRGSSLRRAAWFVPALAVLVALDLYTTNGHYALSPGGNPAPVLQAVRFVRADPATPFRVSSEGLLPGSGDASMLYDYEDILGSSSLEPALLALFWQRVATDGGEGRALDLLNVKYILTERDLPARPGEFTLAHEEGALNLYRIEHPLPRAYVVYSATIAADLDTAVARLRAPDFDPRSEVVLGGGAEVALANPFGGASTTTDPSAVGAETARVAGPAAAYTAAGLRIDAPTQMVIDVDLPRPGVLVISQRAFPGWEASIDGRPAPVLAANIAFNAVAVPAGRHTIVWSFAPRSALFGGIVSALSLAALLALIARRPGV